MKYKPTQSKNGNFYSVEKENDLYWIFSHGKPKPVGNKGHYTLSNGMVGVFWSKDKVLVKRLFKEMINLGYMIKQEWK